MPPTPVSLAEKVDFLSAPQAYAEGAGAVSPMETHMSWVFLTDTEVWKLKKPVCFPPLDFSTLAMRETHCRAEIILNRRLAPDVYLGTHRLTLDAHGHMAIDGPGETVEWLVRMRRLPEARMLDIILENGAPTKAEIDQLSVHLAAFYKSLPSIHMPARDFLERYHRRQANNRSMILKFASVINFSKADRVLDGVDAFLADYPSMLLARLDGGRVVEGHGDMRAEHVCLTDPPRVIDCLEFERDLRLMDPFEEAAFLGLDCARLGAAWIGPQLIGNLSESLGNSPPAALSDFYTVFHACVRARIALRHLEDAQPSTPERWPVMAESYFDAAAAALARISR
jgi:uncharacterized protein